MQPAAAAAEFIEADVLFGIVGDFLFKLSARSIPLVFAALKHALNVHVLIVRFVERFGLFFGNIVHDHCIKPVSIQFVSPGGKIFGAAFFNELCRFAKARVKRRIAFKLS